MKSNHVWQQFQSYIELQYSGKLEIKGVYSNKQWSFYYRSGQIVWATEEFHKYRRLRRQIKQNCPQLDLNKLQLSPQDISVKHWDYKLLENLYQQKQIHKEQFKSIVSSTIGEVLFDLAQNLNFTDVTCQISQEIITDALINSTSANLLIQQMQESWNNWSKAGLEKVSPNLAPVIRKPAELKQKVSASVYNNFEKMVNGKYSLWDISAKMQQSILPITRSLSPYIQEGIAELIEIPDLPLPLNKIADKTPQSVGNLNAPLVACIDDSVQICESLKKIVTSQGMRFIAIDDPVQALPTLMQTKPDLIFIDLMMPIVNGYEICEQLRRSTKFANTPIVILTSSDGVFDRVRSRVFGATEFINKPVEMKKIVGVLNKYLLPTPDVESFGNLAYC
ncbi:MAG TPA: response regulator [Nostocaceae cyanobacterium]|nr:response regulator [Nostocaceae cyanobacterium]